jgi:hypothetical protein
MVMGKEGNGTLRVRVLPDDVTLWKVACNDELGAGGRCRGCDTDVRGICPDALRRSVSFFAILSITNYSNTHLSVMPRRLSLTPIKNTIVISRLLG